MAFQKVKTSIRCENCGYAWNYKGKLRRTTCPNCGNKTRTPQQQTPSNLSTPEPQEDPTSKIIREYLES
jgi:Zn finger protein HypA/HybF involved in hydrogenase expression